MEKTTIEVPSIALPKGGGAIKGIGEMFSSDAFTGAGAISFPVYVSPARGFEPNLVLGYSSGAGNSAFGIGFSLSLPSISRRTEKGIPRYDSTDVFVLSDVGALVPVAVQDATGAWVADSRCQTDATGVQWVVTPYRPQAEGSFASIELWQNNTGDAWWKVLTRDNVTHIYGQNTDARIADPADAAHIFSWFLQQSTDAVGNKQLYHYKRENGANIPPALYEQDRSIHANTYIESVRYGNYIDADGNEQYAFEVVFNYGGYDLENPDAPPTEWLARSDPFSTYRAGFEIRTLRLCRSILMFHRFPDMFHGERFLVRALCLEQEQTPVLSFVKAVQSIGYRKQESGVYEREDLPPISLQYAPFRPEEQEFKPLLVEDGGLIPGALSKGQFLPVDLYGEGLPGILYSGSTVTLYWKPQGDAVFGYPEAPVEFPIERNLADARYALADIDGNGAMELVVTAPRRSGYYQECGNGEWEPYQGFVSYPTAAEPTQELVDLNGDGLSDIVLLNNGALVYYPSEGTRGFGASVRTEQRAGFPVTSEAGAGAFLGFADVFGDGLQHLVRIRSGMVECWPNIGYGRFAPKVLLGTAPQYKGGLSASRIFLADTDGSGTADIVYVYPDRAEIYLNQSGNSFAPQPIVLALPEQYNNTAQITFADITGSGSTSLVMSVLEPEVRHYYCDFGGKGRSSGAVLSQKPYLLTAIDNNLGATTLIQYASSTKFYLEAKRAGKPWVTKLPFPVQVVETVENLDQISGGKAVQQFAYHDGYYDPVEREFRGFGFVESWDTQEFEVFAQTSLHGTSAFRAGTAELHVPAAYTKTWFHTGAYMEQGVISRQYESEYWHGDPNAFPMPDSSFGPGIATGDAQTLREAYAAMKGEQLRSEVYGLDGSVRESTPFTVTESAFHVRLLQPPVATRSGAFFAFERESIVYNYERDPADPRVEHSFALEVDAYGNTTRSCQVYYPRRAPALPSAEPPADPANALYKEQTTLQVVVEETSVINETKGFRLLGIPCDVQGFELGGTVLPASQYFTWSEISVQVQESLAHTIRYGEKFSDGKKQARLISWTRMVYSEGNVPLPPCTVGPRALLYRTEEAVFPPEFVQDVYGARVTEAMLAERGGYVFDEGYWWNPGASQMYYTDPKSFSQPHSVDDVFGGRVFMQYDPYWFAIVAIEQLVQETPTPVCNTVTAQYDYQVMKPCKITNINGVVSDALFNPLGFPIVTSVRGVVDGQPYGDIPASDYKPRQHATFDDVLQQPYYYLEGATAYYYYDVWAWVERSQPANSITLLRETHCTELPPGENTAIQQQITYSDGFGREIEIKLKGDPGNVAVQHDVMGVQRGNDGRIILAASEENWIVSGRTVYNNKGLPVEQYLPYYTATPYYEDTMPVYEQGIVPPPEVTRYDPLGRIVRVDTPKGFFSKREYTSWVWRMYDEDDTVKDSRYYKEHFSTAPPDEKDALEKASVFENTPTEDVLDNRGRRFLQVQINVWDEQDDGTGATGGVQGPFYLTTFYILDAAGNVLAASDPRLSQLSPPVANIVSAYDMTTRLLRNNSVDAGDIWTLPNVFGNAADGWNSRELHTSTEYDLLQRPVQVRVQGHDEQNRLTLDNIVERIVYGENAPNGEGKNLRGEVYQYYDQAGVLTTTLYNIQSQALHTERQLLQDYKTEVNWAAIGDVPLDPEIYPLSYSYDALKRLTLEITPDGTTTQFGYTAVGPVQTIVLTFADGTTQTVVQDIRYDASLRRKRVSYGNGTATEYTYEETTERLLQLYTTRPTDVCGGSDVAQHTVYTYDPVGNVTRTQDYTHQTVFCDQQQVEALSGYTYDAIYRLKKATGRQHPGIVPSTHITGFKQSLFMPLCQTPHPNDMQKLQVYKELYTYDNSGNLTQTQHYAPPGTYSWTRSVDVPVASNRAVPTDSPNTTYDNAGNMLALDNIQTMYWNYRNNIARADVITRKGDTTNDSDYFVYDFAGNRVRKVVERFASGGAITDVQESIYIGNLVIQRTKKQSAESTAVLSERQSLRVLDGESAAVIVEHTVLAASLLRRTEEVTRQFRYQLSNSLGSSVVELDENACVISYEEYFPFGGTSVIAGNNEVEVSPKVYRYSGKEADDSTGLYYYGARYYISWLGRWASPDPAGPVDGLNLYEFVGNNPLSYVDVGGTCKKKKAAKTAKKTVKKDGSTKKIKKEAPKRKKEKDEGSVADRVKRQRRSSRADSSSPPVFAVTEELVSSTVTALSSLVATKRGEIQTIINRQMTKSEKRIDTGNTNVEAMRVIMKNGTQHDHLAFSNMSRLVRKSEREGSTLASEFVPGVTADTAFVTTIDQKTRGGQFDNHTEPKLLNFAISNYTVSDISAIILVGEMAPCSDTCAPVALPSFVGGEVYNPSTGGKIDTTSIALRVFDTASNEYVLQRHEAHNRNEFLLN